MITKGISRGDENLDVVRPATGAGIGSSGGEAQTSARLALIKSQIQALEAQLAASQLAKTLAADAKRRAKAVAARK